MSETNYKYAMLVDLTRCVGCRSCSVACKSENDVPSGVVRTWVKEIEKGSYPLVKRHPMPMLCNQCENAACTRVCPVKATYHNEEGIVVIDPHRCIGCGYCMAACPYAMRFIHPTRRVAEKCDWCWPRLREDQGPPACVRACPGGVLTFGDPSDPNSEIAKKLLTSKTTVLKPETGNRPRVYYIGLDDEAARKVDAGGHGG